MTRKEKKFIEYVKSECKKYGIKCDLRKTSYVVLPGNIKCSGYFYESGNLLVCATNKKEWIDVLAHEFCHVTQWIDQIPLWIKAQKSIPLVDDWLTGEKVRNIKKHLEVCRDLELDNEKRTVKLMKEFDLDIDIEDYIKKANAYIFFYTRLLATRKWPTPTNSPHSNDKIIKTMPRYFKTDYSYIPKKIETVFIQENL